MIPPGTGPSVADAIRTAAGGRPKFEAEQVIDKLNEKFGRKPPEDEEEEGDGGDEEGEGAPPPGGAPHGLDHCPRCKWDLSSGQPPAPSADDRAVFVAAVLGDNRFVKDYDLFGGKLRVAFRSLSTRGGDLALKQLAQDQGRGLVADRADFMRLFWDYRLCLSLLWVEVDGDRVDAAGPVDEMLTGLGAADGHVTTLPTILERLQDCKPLGEETVWRVVGQAYRHQFQALVDGLELKANDPSFWHAIEG